MIWLAAVLGLVAGSFIGVVIWRLPQGMPLAGRSFCPSCGAQLAWWENIPVISWVVLRGRCGHCGRPISAIHPIQEVGTAVLWAALWVRLDPPDPAGVTVYVLEAVTATALVAAAAIDLDHGVIPNRLTLWAAVQAVELAVIAVLLGGDVAAGAVAGAVAATVPFLVFTMTGAMGAGDLKLAPTVGLSLGVLGTPTLMVGLVAPWVIAGIPATVVLARGGRGARIRFGPAIAAGWLVGVAFGGPVADALGWTALLP